MLVFHGNRVMLAREVVGIKTCGSTLRSACSRNFIAYFAKSAALSYGPIDDWPCAVKALTTSREKKAKNLLIKPTSGVVYPIKPGKASFPLDRPASSGSPLT
jgi:hypothetical protein